MHDPLPQARGPSPSSGRMTAVMRAAGVPRARVLRVGVVRDARMIEERVVAADVLTVGPAERADLVLPARDLGRRHRLLERRGGSWWLALASDMRGRVATSGGVLELTGESPPQRLESDARGKVVIGTTTLLFQLVPAPPVQSRPRLPLSVMRRETGDWGTTIIAALSFLLHFGIMGVLFSDWVDPVVDQGVVVSGLVDSVRTLPAPPVEASSKSATSAPAASAEPTPATATARNAGHGKPGPHKSGPMDSDSAARLQRQLVDIEMKTLGSLAATGPATADVLRGSEVPTSALDHAAKSAAGVGPVDPFHIGSSGAPLHPGEQGSLADIGNSHGADDGNTGRVRHVVGPTTKTLVESHREVGIVPDAARVVAGLRPAFHTCYRHELEGNPDAHGKVQLTLRIGAGGEVDGVSATHSGNLSSSVVRCMIGHARTAEFSPPTEGSAVISVPVSLVLNR